MKKILGTFILFLLLSAIPAVAQPENCKSVHEGTFKSYAGNEKITIVRKGNIQTEKVAKLKIKMGVTWTDDCTYILTLIKSNVKNDPFEGNPITVVITSVTDRGYTWTASASGMDDWDGEFLWDKK